ncbi:hypothetical protein Vafri_3649, partial [Volvox africanus]
PLSQYLYPYPYQHQQPPPQPVSTTEAAWEAAAPVERSRDVRGSGATRVWFPPVLSDSRRRLKHSGGSSSGGDGENVGERGYGRGLAPSPSPSPSPSSSPQQQRLRSDRARQPNQWRCGDGAGVEWIDIRDLGDGHGVHGKAQDELCQRKQGEGSDGSFKRGRKGFRRTSQRHMTAADGLHGSVWKCGGREQAAAAVRSGGTSGGRRRRGGSINPSDSASECSSESSHSHGNPTTERHGKR